MHLFPHEDSMASEVQGYADRNGVGCPAYAGRLG